MKIVPVGELAVDEGPRRDTSLAALAALPPVFDPEGTTTAGSRPGVNDEDACLIVTSEAWARARGIEPAGRIVARGGSPTTSPTLPARRPRQPGWRSRPQGGRSTRWRGSRNQQAFSSVAAHSTALLGVDEDRVNVNGGAVALGHPIGASGGRILATLVHELRRSGGGLGLAAICSGGGQGDALLVEV